MFTKQEPKITQCTLEKELSEPLIHTPFSKSKNHSVSHKMPVCSIAETSDAYEVILTQPIISEVRHLEMTQGKEEEKSIISITRLHSITESLSWMQGEEFINLTPIFTSASELDKNRILKERGPRRRTNLHLGWLQLCCSVQKWCWGRSHTQKNPAGSLSGVKLRRMLPWKAPGLVWCWREADRHSLKCTMCWSGWDGGSFPHSAVLCIGS